MWLDKPRVGDEERDENVAVLLAASFTELYLLLFNSPQHNL
jgi:hypothetical protein